MRHSRFADSLTVAGLVLLGIVPAIAGSVRLHQLARGVVSADNARFLAMPWPVVAHVVGAVLFALPGALQLSGLWMAQFYPRVAFDGAAVYWERIVVGVAMTASLWLGVTAVRRHDLGAHRAWMMRAWALGMGAGTQVLTLIPLMLAPSLQSELSRALAMGAAWAINAVVAEYFIQRSVHSTAANPQRIPASIRAAVME